MKACPNDAPTGRAGSPLPAPKVVGHPFAPTGAQETAHPTDSSSALATRPTQIEVLALLLIWGSAISTYGSVQLSVGSATASTGSTISVPAGLSSDTNVVAAQYDVLFNSTALNSSDPTPGNVQPNHSVSSGLVSPAARRVVLYSSANAALTNGVLANLIFSVATNAPLGVTSLTLTNVIFSNAQGNRVQRVTLVPGLITISPAPGTFDSVVLSTNGVVQFQITGTPNISYIIQASANLQLWADVSTNIANGGIINFVDPQATQFRYRFYRIKLGQ